MSRTSPEGAPLRTGGGKGGAPHKDFFCTFLSECVSCTLCHNKWRRGGEVGATEALDFIIIPTHQYKFYIFLHFQLSSLFDDQLFNFFFADFVLKR